MLSNGRMIFRIFGIKQFALRLCLAIFFVFSLLLPQYKIICIWHLANYSQMVYLSNDLLLILAKLTEKSEKCFVEKEAR